MGNNIAVLNLQEVASILKFCIYQKDGSDFYSFDKFLSLILLNIRS